MDLHEKIAIMFKAKMKEKGLSVKDVCETTGLSKYMINKILHASKVKYRVTVLLIIVEFLEVKCKDLLGF